MKNSEKSRQIAGVLLTALVTKASAQSLHPTPLGGVDASSRLQAQEQRNDALRQLQKQLGDFATEGVATVPASSSDAEAKKNADLPAAIAIRDIVIDFHSGPKIGSLLEAAKKVKQKTLSPGEIFALISYLNDILIHEGYTTSYVRLIGLNHEDGVLKVDVAWGRVDGLLVNGDPPHSLREKLELQSAWPYPRTHVFNVADLDQAIENLSTLGKQATVSVQPSAETGYSTLNFRIKPRRNYQFSLSFDNSGTGGASEGRYKTSIGFSTSDLLGLNELFSFNVGAYYHRDVAHNNQYPLAASGEFPFGPWRTKFSYSNYLYESIISGQYGRYLTKGRSENMALREDYTPYRSQFAKISLFGSVIFQRQDNYIEGQRLSANSGTQSLVEIGMTALYSRSAISGFTSLSLEKGFELFSADSGAYSNGALVRNPYLIKGTGQVSVPFRFGGRSFRYDALIGGQYSPYSLVPVLKLQIGDQNSLRAYKGESFAGDSGLYLNQTVYWLANFHELEIQPYLGVDFGFLKENVDAAANVRVLDAAAGVVVKKKDASLNVSVGRTIWQRGAYSASSSVLFSVSTYF